MIPDLENGKEEKKKRMIIGYNSPLKLESQDREGTIRESNDGYRAK